MKTLIDEPITPYSPAAEIEAWIERCRREIEKQPENADWREALARAQEMLAHAKRDAER